MAFWIARVARRVRTGFITFHRANQQASALLMSRGLVETDRAPDTYAEFLLRAPRAAVHEPPARRR
jgi:hypothetical protein